MSLPATSVWALVLVPCFGFPVDTFSVAPTLRVGDLRLPVVAFALGLCPLLRLDPPCCFAFEADWGLLSMSTPSGAILTASGVLIFLKAATRCGGFVLPLLAFALDVGPMVGVGSLGLLAPKFGNEVLDSLKFRVAVSALFPTPTSFVDALPSFWPLAVPPGSKDLVDTLRCILITHSYRFFSVHSTGWSKNRKANHPLVEC